MYLKKKKTQNTKHKTQNKTKAPPPFGPNLVLSLLLMMIILNNDDQSFRFK